MNKFLIDKGIGEYGENRVISVLNNFGIKSKIDSTPYHDIKFILDGKKYFIEVKNDISSNRTGNIAIEIWNTCKDMASGIMTTDAHFWVHIINYKLYLTSVNKLKNFIKCANPIRQLANVGDGNAAIMLYSIDSILPIFLDLETITSKDEFRKAICELL